MMSNKITPIRLSIECQNAWDYLERFKINRCDLLREGGESLVINKAKEFNFKERINKVYVPF
jgi:hypothetical protein